MVGILDLITGQAGALYPSPLQGEADQAQQAREVAAAVLARRFRGGSHAPAPEPAAPEFGAGATPFSFAGPGSMNIDPSMIAPPASPASSPFASGAPAVPFAGGPAAPRPVATDVSSSNRTPTPDSFVPVGDYQMPMIGRAPQSAPDPAAAPSPAAPASPAPFSLGGSGLGDRLMKGTRGFMGNMAAGPIGALMGGIGALVTGQETDPTSIARGNANLTARALLAKGASPAEVQAATHNPALMKALVENYYGKDRWQVVQVGEDGQGGKTYMQQNQIDGTLRPIPGVSASAGGDGGTVTGPDGKPIAIPPGVNRKDFIKRVTDATADAATGKLTEEQAKSGMFATRMTQAQGDLAKLENEGLSPWNRAAGAVPLVGNYLQSKEYQRYKTAASSFITAMLRRESGAAVQPAEFDRYEKELFPQPGDDPSVVQQKARMRAAAVEEMRRSAGPGYKAPAAAPGGASGKTSSGISWSVR